MPFIGKGKGKRATALPAPFVDASTQPAFVLGGARSGTSVVRYVLESCAGFEGFREGHFASAIPLLMTQLDRQYDEYAHVMERKQQVLIANTDKERLKRLVADLFAAWMVDLAPRERWLDKTPGGRMVRAAPLLAEALPRARFLYCVRRGIENVISRQRKFPDVAFEMQCVAWADAVQAWLEVRDSLADVSLVVKQHELARHPDRVAEEIRALLGLSADEGAAIARGFVQDRPEQTGFTQPRFMGLDETPWTEEERGTFVEKCGAEMEMMGFPLEGAALDVATPLRLFWAVAGDVVEVVGVTPADFTCEPDGSLGVRLDGAAETRAIRYRDVPMVGHDRFSTRVSFSRECGTAVDLSLRIERDGDAVVDRQTRALPGSELPLSVDWEPLHGPHDVVISMRPAARSAPFTVIWRNPTIDLRPRA